MVPTLTLLADRLAAAARTPCNFSKPGLFGLPTWYSYLPGQTDAIDPSKCIPTINSYNQLPAIGLAVVDILLHLAGLLAVAFVMYGAFLYVTSHGEPDRVSSAKDTLINAIIGLVIVLLAIAIVSFVGGLF
jgi:hypothetical protein